MQINDVIDGDTQSDKHSRYQLTYLVTVVLYTYIYHITSTGSNYWQRGVKIEWPGIKCTLNALI